MAKEPTDINEFRRRKQEREATKKDNEDVVRGRRIEITEEERKAMRGISSAPVPSHFIYLPPVEAHERPAPPIHKVGDRVIDFRGESKGTIAAIHVSDDPGKSHKVTVQTDAGYQEHNYESVWHPLYEDTPVTPINKNKK